MDYLGINSLTEEERYVICLSIFLHDLGCLIGRRKHNELSLKILNHPQCNLLEYKVGSDMFACVKYLAVSHSSNYDFNHLPRHAIHPRIRLDLVCALFRLIDACDLMPSRAYRVLYEILMRYDPLGRKSQKIWKAHFNIKSVVFKNNQIVISSKNLSLTKPLIDHLKRDIVAINEILRRHGLSDFSVDEKKVR